MSIMCRLLVAFTSTLLVLTIIESVGAGTYHPYHIDEYMTVPNNETGIKVAQWTEEMNMNPEELGNYFEGDIMISNSTTRNGDTKAKRWPNRQIPYVITGRFTQKQRNLIQDAMKQYHSKTCMRFKKRTNQKDYLDIRSDNTGCWSWIGRRGGKQQVNLQAPGCVNAIGTPVHELLHAIGFWHEHTREDRDGYVNINWNNIPKNQQHNFMKANKGQTTSYGVRYDYGSVMHYSAYAFAKNPKVKTIITKKPKNAKIGQRRGLSNSDITKIKRMYKC
ncbi:PREDICTED: zinc metalloproteinase nas-4-like [Wasmannia auropunctata]|uniref:zinc metalloproteinase nas-4-like n=1 Tax=Wasmannia auropunctata TaxID=64793 RepID=UPI0005EDCB05|nr:PREDICTED: zinc metalloproteinase nas-4-like [Wasmannia auropunctata]